MTPDANRRIADVARAKAARTLMLLAAARLASVLPPPGTLERAQISESLLRELAAQRTEIEQMPFPDFHPVEADHWVQAALEAFDELAAEFLQKVRS